MSVFGLRQNKQCGNLRIACKNLFSWLAPASPAAAQPFNGKPEAVLHPGDCISQAADLVLRFDFDFGFKIPDTDPVRRFRQILDVSGNPISINGDAETDDDDGADKNRKIYIPRVSGHLRRRCFQALGLRGKLINIGRGHG